MHTVDESRSIHETESPPAVTVAEAIDRLTDEYRDLALWFLRKDYYPTTAEERLRVLRYIEERADVPTFQRVARLRKWLLQHSSEKSAG